MGSPLIIKADYKAYVGLSSNNEDTKIDTLIPKVSKLVKSLCHNSFNEFINDPCIEIFEGGTSYYVLQEGPPLIVYGLEYSADYGNTYVPMTEFVDYTFSKPTHMIKRIGRDFVYTPNGYRVTYTAGYEVLPEDLKLAVMDLVTYYMKNDPAVHSNRPGFGSSTVQIEYITNTKVPAHIARVLDLYANTYN